MSQRKANRKAIASDAANAIAIASGDVETQPVLLPIIQMPVLPNMLTVSTSSGYSTSDEQVQIPPPRPPLPKSTTTKRKTRSLPASGYSTAQHKRLKVDAVFAAVAVEQTTAVVCSDGGGGSSSISNPQRAQQTTTNVVSSKPPLPPTKQQQSKTATKRKAVTAAPSIHGKLRNDEPTMLNKLNAYADQCRAEIGELKVALANEKAAVRALR